MTAPNWFIGLVVPPEARWHELRSPLPAGVRPYHPGDLHLTLAFLGACDEGAAARAWRAVAGLTAAPLLVRAGAWRAMGAPQAPSAYALTLAEGHDEAARLIRDWGGPARGAAGLGPERRAPLPHVTVARSRRRGAAAGRSAMAEWMAAAPLPGRPCRLRELALYTWSRRRGESDAPLFELVARRPLAPPGPQLDAEV
ncbi:MAG: 2'-5' RNA ligase family protein [Synechococcaceae cyanobacterium]